MSTSGTQALTVDSVGPLELTVTDSGTGPTYLLLHGGGGPQTVTAFADLLTATRGRVITPVHPGFGGTVRPDALSTVAQLAQLYIALLDELDLHDVTAIGNSLGGWVASEIALLHSPRVSRLIIIDGVGIDVADHPIIDFFSIPPDQITRYSFHDPEKFRIDPETLPPTVRAALPGNRGSLAAYAGTTMSDPSLARRLGGVTTPTLVLWGDADKVVDPDYGRAYAAAIPAARFELLTATGHLPHVETPEQVLQAVQRFCVPDPDEQDNPMWRHEYTAETDLEPSAIWASVRALRTGELPTSNGDQLALQGPFAVGSTILTRPEGVSETLASRITELVELRTFAIETVFNGLTLLHRYNISRTNDTTTQITLVLGISGPGAEKIAPEIGPRISADYPEAVQEIIDVARRNVLPSAPAASQGRS